MAKKNDIKIGVGFDIDESGIKELRRQLDSLNKITFKDLMKDGNVSFDQARVKLENIRDTADTVQKAIGLAFNPKLNTVNLQTFNRVLKEDHITIQKIQTDFSAAGATGNAAFRSLANQLTNVNVKLKTTHSLLDRAAETLGNTIKWNIASGAINRLTGSVQEAYGYVKALDRSLNDIQIVTDKNADSMQKFAVQANKAAKDLGTTTTEYTKAALTFYQQGLSDEEAQARATLSNKVANVTGLSGDQSAEYVTAVLNGYKVTAEGAEEAMDKLAAVGAATAADLGGLSEAMSKVASSANAMGVSEDQLASTLATVQSVTRQSAATVGTAFKTIYARMADIEAGAEGAETTLGHYTEEMARMGFSVLDSAGHLRDLGSVMEEIGGQWHMMTREQQVSLAQTMAGTRQYNNLIALFDNWDDYVKTLNVSLEANGTLQKQQNIYLSGTAAHLNQLKSSMENVYDSFLDSDTIEGFADAISGIANSVASLLDSIGGGIPLLETLGTLALTVFSKQIGKSISTTLTNFELVRENAEMLQNSLAMVKNISTMEGLDSTTQALMQNKEAFLSLFKIMNPGQVEELTANFNKLTESLNFADKIKADVEAIDRFINLGRAEGSKLSILGDMEFKEEAIQTALGKNLENIKVFQNKLKQNAWNSGENWKNEFLKGIGDLAPEVQNKVKKALELSGTKDDPFGGKTSLVLEQIFKNAEKDAMEMSERISSILNGTTADVKDALTAAYTEAQKTGEEISKALGRASRQELISNFTSLAGAISSTAMAFSNLSHVWDVLTNDDLDPSEKALQTLMNLSMFIPMVINGYQNMKKSLAGMSAASQTYSTAQEVAQRVQTERLATDTTTTNINSQSKENNKNVVSQQEQAIEKVNKDIQQNTALLNENTQAQVKNSNSKKKKQNITNLSGKKGALNKRLKDGGFDIDSIPKDELEKYYAQNLSGAVSNKGAIQEKQFKPYKPSQVYQNAYDAKKAAQETAQVGDAVDKATKKAGKGVKGLSASLTGLIGTLSTVMFWAGAILAVIKVGKQIIETHRRNEIESLQKQIEETEKFEEKNRVLNESYVSYQKLYEQYQRTGKVTDDFIDATSELTNQLGIQTGTIDQLGGRYESLNQKIAESIRLEKEKSAQNAKIGLDLQSSQLSLEADNKYLLGQYTTATNVDLSEKGKKVVKDIYGEELIYAQATERGDEDVASIDLSKISGFELYEKREREFNELNKILTQEEKTKSLYFQELTKYLQDSQELYLKAKENQKKFIQYSTEAIAALGESGEEFDFDAEKVTSLQSFDKYKQEYIERLTEQLGGKEAIGGLYDHDQYASDEEYLDSLAQKFFLTVDDMRDYAQAAAVQKTLFDILIGDPKNTVEEVQDFINQFNESDLKIIASVGIDETASRETILRALDFGKTLIDHTITTEVTEAMNTMIELSNKQQKKKLTKDEQSKYDEANSIFKDFIGEDFETKKEWAIISEEGYAKQIEWMQDLAAQSEQYGEKTLDDIKNRNEEELAFQAEHLLDLNRLVKGMTEKIESYQSGSRRFYANDEEYQAALKQYKDYQRELIKTSNYLTELQSKTDDDFQVELQIANMDEILTVTDLIVQQMDKVQEATDLIGKGFTVAAESAEKFAEIFPEMLANATVAADGTIELNQEVVKNELDGQEAILTGDVEVALGKIQNQRVLLENDKAAAERKLELAKALANNEISTKEALDEISALSGESEKDILENVNKFKIETLNQQSQALGQNTTDAIENYKAEAKAGVAAANEIIKSHEAAGHSVHAASVGSTNPADYQEYSWNDGAVSGKGTSTSYTAVTASQYQPNTQDVQQRKDQRDWLIKYLEESGKSDLAAAVQGLADLTVAESKLRRGLNDSLDSLQGATSGKGNVNKDFMESLKDTVDIYHDINLEIEKLNRNLSNLEKEEDTLFGTELLTNLNKQLAVLKEQNTAYAEKLRLAKEEARTVGNKLAGQGVIFDSEGSIANYNQILQDKENYVNGLINAYNAMSEADQKINKDTVELAKKHLEEFKKQIGKYDELISKTIPGLEDQIKEALYKEIDLQIQKFDLKIQMRLDMAEAEREWNDFKRKIIDDLEDDDLLGKALYGQKDILTYYNTNNTGTGTIQTQTGKVNTILDELRKMDAGGHSDIYSAYDEATGVWADNKGKAIEDLQTAYKDLMKDLESVKDLENEVRDAFLGSIDAIHDAYNAQKENFEFVDAQINHDIKLMQMLYGDKAYDKMDAYYEKQLQNTKDQLAAQQIEERFWKEKLDAEQAAVAAGTGDKDALAKYEANWKEAVSNVNSLLENWADQATAKYENTVDMMVQTLNDKLSNGKGLEYLDEQLKLLNDNADNYLDAINSAYEVQKLQSKWEDAIANTDSISAQEQLNDLMNQQLQMLEEKGKLTQYDIDRAEKEYEIALKQIALQEAQQNKSTMRLKRDANGNYSYQFVSDEDSVRDAQQELDAAKNDLYNFDKSAYEDNLNNMYSVWSEFQDKVAEAYKTYANDTDALNEHIALLQEQYGEKINYLTEQNLNLRGNLTSSAFDELSILYDLDVQNLQNMSQAEKDIIIEELVPQWNSGVQDMIDKFAGEGGFGPVCKETFEDLAEKAQEHRDELDQIRDKNQEVADETLAEGEELLDQSQDLIDAMQDEYNRIGEVMAQVGALREAYLNAKQAAIEATNEAYKYMQSARQLREEMLETQRVAQSMGSSSAGAFGSFGSFGSGGSGGDRPSKTETSSQDNLKGFKIYNPFVPDQYEIKYFSSLSSAMKYWKSLYGMYPGGFPSAKKVEAFKTGGYTGSWGEEGRLAMLHQKELVLNAQDTENMLNAVSIMRGIVDSIGASALSKASSLLDGLGISTGNFNNSNKETIEQSVHIDARFEGQTEADQIQTALSNLVNVAAQRANRTGR